MEWQNDDYIITDNREDLDVERIHRFLQDSYWAEGILREVVEQSIEHSLCFGLFHEGQQIGFARAVTDQATFAYLADVFVIHDYQGRGLGKWLVSCIREHPELQNLRRWILATADAHGLYEQYGFSALSQPDIYMEINKRNHYQAEES